MHRKSVRWVGLVLIGLIFGAKAWYHWPAGTQPSNADVIQAVKEAKKEAIEDVTAALHKQAVNANQDEEDRLRKDYPLGYVIFAFSGEKIVHLLCTDRVDSDWDHVKVYREGKDIVFIEPLYLYDKRDDKRDESGFESCAFGMPAKPGGKSIRLRIRNSFIAQAECIRTKPIGLCVVLGFMECPNK